MKNSNEFDKFANNYRELHTKNVQNVSGESSNYFSEYKIKELCHVFSANSHLNFLDLGCGDGNTARYVKQYFPLFDYQGLDVSAESVEMAISRGIDGCEFKVYDGGIIPYDDNTFDVVFMACVMHHVDKEKHVSLLSEVYRVLKKGGKLIVFEHNPYNPLTRRLVKDCPFDDGAILISAKQLINKILKSGFMSRGVLHYTIFMPRKGLFHKMIFLEKKLFWLPLGGQYYYISEK